MRDLGQWWLQTVNVIFVIASFAEHQIVVIVVLATYQTTRVVAQWRRGLPGWPCGCTAAGRFQRTNQLLTFLFVNEHSRFAGHCLVLIY